MTPAPDRVDVGVAVRVGRDVDMSIEFPGGM
jgi:hypothetical protein